MVTLSRTQLMVQSFVYAIYDLFTTKRIICLPEDYIICIPGSTILGCFFFPLLYIPDTPRHPLATTQIHTSRGLSLRIFLRGRDHLSLVACIASVHVAYHDGCTSWPSLRARNTLINRNQMFSRFYDVWSIHTWPYRRKIRPVSRHTTSTP